MESDNNKTTGCGRSAQNLPASGFFFKQKCAQRTAFFKLQKFAFKAIGCFLSTGCYFMKITNDG